MPSSLYKQVALRVREARRRAGLTQEAAAQAAGVSHMTISRLERGVTRNPKTDELERIAKALGTTVEALVADDTEPTTDETVSFADLQRRIAAITGNREVSIGLAGVVANWDRLGLPQQRMIAAAVEAALSATPADDDIGLEDITKSE